MTYPTKTHRAAHGYQITRLEPYDLPVEQLLSMLTTARQLKLAVSRRPDGSGVGALVVRAEYFPERVSVGGLHFVTMPIPGEDEVTPPSDIGFFNSAAEAMASQDKLACLIDVLSPKFIALSCISEASHSVAARLAELGDEGILEYEIGRTSGLEP